MPTKRMSEVKQQQRRGSSFMNRIPFFGSSAKMTVGEPDIEGELYFFVLLLALRIRIW